MSNHYPSVTVTFTPEERQAFLARTDRAEHETILWPYEAFIYAYLGEWHSLSLTNPDEWPEDEVMPPAASGYVVELLDERCKEIFDLHAHAIRRSYDEHEAFKARWPYRIRLGAVNNMPDHCLHAALVDTMFAAEIAYAKANSLGAVSHVPFLDEREDNDYGVFGFEREEDAAMFKMRWL